MKGNALLYQLQIMISEGYAKPYDKYYCTQLPTYQIQSFAVKQQKKGLYNYVQNF